MSKIDRYDLRPTPQPTAEGHRMTLAENGEWVKYRSANGQRMLELGEYLGTFMKAIEDEPELPDEESEEAKLMIAAMLHDSDSMIEGMRILVRLTKDGIKARATERILKLGHHE